MNPPELFADTQEIDSKWERQFSALSEQMAVFEARIIKWMFVMWIGTIGTLIALMGTFIAVMKF